MIFKGLCEYRSFESKSSKNGNLYLNVYCEDERGVSTKFYCPADNTSDVMNKLSSVNKGDMVNAVLNYHLNYGEWKTDLVDVEKVE